LRTAKIFEGLSIFHLFFMPFFMTELNLFEKNITVVTSRLILFIFFVVLKVVMTAT